MGVKCLQQSREPPEVFALIQLNAIRIRTKSSKSRRKERKDKSRRHPSKKAIIGIVLIVVVLTVGLLLYASLISSGPKQVVVVIPEGAGENLHVGFDPVKITIVIGVNNTVVWKNEDNDWHTAHSNIPEFNSGLIESGASFTHIFQRPGTYPYHCDPHPWMTGLVIVESSSTTGIIQPSINSSMATVLGAFDRMLQSI